MIPKSTLEYATFSITCIKGQFFAKSNNTEVMGKSLQGAINALHDIGLRRMRIYYSSGKYKSSPEGLKIQGCFSVPYVHKPQVDRCWDCKRKLVYDHFKTGYKSKCDNCMNNCRGRKLLQRLRQIKS